MALNTTPARHTVLLAGAVALTVAIAAGCAPDEEAATDDGGDTFEEVDDRESQAGDDLQDADGILLSVMPACAHVGDDLEITAEGLEPDTDHDLLFVPEPSETGEFESGTIATSDGDGMLAVDATLTEDAGIQTGDYDLELRTANEGDDETFLIATDLQIVESTADCDIGP
jgi:hypothetical protein